MRSCYYTRLADGDQKLSVSFGGSIPLSLLYRCCSGILLCVLFLGVSLGLTACQADSLEETTLTVSPDEELLLPASGEGVILSVRTNQHLWSAVTNSSWLKLRQAGDKLLVEASPNSYSDNRVGQIILIAGKLQKQLSVKQVFDAQYAIELLPAKELLVDRLTKEYRIIVKTSSNRWRVRKENDRDEWLTVLPRPRYGEIILNFEENKTRATRATKLFIEDGEAVKEFVVSQRGIPHFFLPYLQWESNLEEAEAFELARHSRITLRPRSGDPVQGLRAVPYFQFSTISSAFQQVRYEYVDMSPRFLYKATLVAQDLAVTRGSELTDFLMQEGYTLRTDLESTESTRFYVNTSQQIHLQYTIDNEAREAYLIFTPIVEQRQAYQVPQTLPLGFSIKNGSTKADVEAWEKQMKSEFAEGITQALGLPAYFSLEPYYLRYYLYKENDANALQSVFVTLDPKYQGLYRYGGLLFMTREFDALLKGQGFVYEAYDQRGGVYYYINEQSNLKLAVSLMRIANLELTRVQTTLLK